LKFEENFIEGIFIKELNRRFVGEVLVNGNIQECHIASSTKLWQYLKLRHKSVILTENKDLNRRTRYNLVAVKYYNKFILLNLNIANKLVEEYLINMRESKNQSIALTKEKLIKGYKADFVLFNDEENLEIIEVKSVLSTRRITKFPNVYSERMVNQLERILLLLQQNIKVSYYIVALSPIIKEIIINSEYVKFYRLFHECISKGMDLKGFSLKYENNEFFIVENLYIKI
jgi:DNA-binding sugar fermentation-stimulating protein